MKITIHPDERLECDWGSSDFSDAFEAIEELGDLIEHPPSVIALRFDEPPVGTSLPRLWRDCVALLEERAFTGAVDVEVQSERVASHFVRYLPEALRPRRSYHFGGVELILTVGDIAFASADALVNASNVRLELGGGVSHALRERFGANLQRQMNAAARGMIEDGQGVITTHPEETGARAIYHVASANGSPVVIRQCIDTVLGFARQRGDAHVVMPLLGTGTGGLEVTTFATLLRECCAATTEPLVLEVWCWTQDDFDVMRDVLGDEEK